MIGTMASIMSSTIVNVAIPDMSHHFTLGQERAQWVSSGFMVAMTVSMLTTPWLLSRYGYRRTYVGTMLLLLVGGIVGGVANDFSLVLFARVAEGLALDADGRFLVAMGEPDDGADPQDRKAAVVHLLQDNLAAEIPGNSRVIDLAFTSRDPELAAQIVNRYSEEFIAFDPYPKEGV